MEKYVVYWRLVRTYSEYVALVQEERDRAAAEGRRPHRIDRHPRPESRCFRTREAAEQHAASLRAEHGDRIVVTIVLKKPVKVAEQFSMAGDWPLQRRPD
jgi:hypothetical protein